MSVFAVSPEMLVLVRHGQSDRNAATAGHVFFPDEASRAPFAGVPERRVLLVTHNGTLRAFRSVREGWTADQFEQQLRGDGHANCAVLAYPPK